MVGVDRFLVLADIWCRQEVYIVSWFVYTGGWCRQASSTEKIFAVDRLSMEVVCKYTGGRQMVCVRT